MMSPLSSAPRVLGSVDRATLRIAAAIVADSGEWFRRNFPLNLNIAPFNQEQYSRVAADLHAIAGRELERAVMADLAASLPGDALGARLIAAMQRLDVLSAELEAAEHEVELLAAEAERAR